MARSKSRSCLARVDTAVLVTGAHHTIGERELGPEPVTSSAHLHRYQRDAGLLQRSPASGCTTVHTQFVQYIMLSSSLNCAFTAQRAIVYSVFNVTTDEYVVTCKKVIKTYVTSPQMHYAKQRY